MNYEFQLVAELEQKEDDARHPMVVYGNSLFVVDGNKIVKMELPVETIWKKIWKLVGF